MRANIIDPAPRRPYSPNSIWKCKFCESEEQSTEHYVKSCKGIDEKVFGGLDREDVYRKIQTLECHEEEFAHITQVLTPGRALHIRLVIP